MSKGFSIQVTTNELLLQSFADDLYDNLHYKDAHLEILIEGVLLNKRKLLQAYALSDFTTLLLEFYTRKKINLLKELEGEFRGYILDKREHKLYVFTNPTATQRIFYGNFNGKIFADSNLVRLSKSLNASGIKPEPRISALYQLIGLGGMLENTTILQDVYKVYDGHYLEIDTEKIQLTEHKYFGFFNEPYFNKPKEEAYRRIHEIFSESVLIEYEKDEELGADHLALLSGGLDSRIAIMYALQQHKKPDNILCFSQSGYLDHRISEKIAEDYGLHYEFIPLDGGFFLKKIDQLTEISEGLVMYPGAIHVQHAMDKLQYQNFKIFHSGQIGDGILGGFNSAPRPEKPSHFKLVYDESLFPKVEEDFQKTIQKYETQETCLIRNLAFNRVLLGAHVFQQKAYQTSPFMTKDFMKFAISLPENWKYQHFFYLEWLRKYCPQARKYQWERTLMKPDAYWKTLVGDKLLKPLYTKLHEKVLKMPEKVSMYPYQYYFDQDPGLQKYYQDYYTENLVRIEAWPELRAEVERLFGRPGFYSKAQAINILSVFKLFF